MRSGEPLDRKQGCQDNTEVLLTLLHHHLFEEIHISAFPSLSLLLRLSYRLIQGAENCVLMLLFSFSN
jgi:hypothetical protein